RRRNGALYEQRPGRHGHRRQPYPRPGEGSAAGILGGRPDLGGVSPNRKDDGGRGAENRGEGDGSGESRAVLPEYDGDFSGAVARDVGSGSELTAALSPWEKSDHSGAPQPGQPGRRPDPDDPG